MLNFFGVVTVRNIQVISSAHVNLAGLCYERSAKRLCQLSNAVKCEVTSDHSNDPTKRGKTDTNSH